MTPKKTPICRYCKTVFVKQNEQQRYCCVKCSALDRIDKSAGPDGCWIWTGGKNDKGYGTMRFNMASLYAHRVMLAEEIGDLGDLDVCHKCDVPACCNPAHLFLGTHKENMADMRKKGRGNQSLRPEQVRNIRALIPILTQERIASAYGVSQSTITNIKRNIVWRREDSGWNPPAEHQAPAE